MSLLSLFLTGLLSLHPDFDLENTNIIMAKTATRNDSNRLRGEIKIHPPAIDGLSANLIIDNLTSWQDTPYQLSNKSSIYRAYVQYRDNRHAIVVGRQRLPFGVGRIWNPIDIFNPINALAIEPDERPGTEAIHYEYAINDLSALETTISRDKYAIRIKGFWQFADFALLGITDNDQQQDIIGWEFSGELWDSGVELRSEGGSFYNRQSGTRHTACIGDLEYSLASSVTIMAEYYFNDHTPADHVGGHLSWQQGPLWIFNLLPIINLTDGSSVISPSASYSLNDEMTLSGGAFFYYGEETSEYGNRPTSYYLRWFVNF